MRRNNLFFQILGWTILFFLIISPAILSAKPIYGSGNSITIKKEIEGFDRVEISNSFNVKINYAKDYAVTIRIDDNLTDYLVVEKSGKTLKIGLKPGRSYINIHPQAVVTLPDICELGLSGASTGVINGFDFGHDFRLDLSGASKIYGSLETGNMNLNLSGASDVNLSGKGKDLEIHASGSSSITMDEFEVADARLELSGSSKCLVNIAGELDVHASGSSKVKYCGPGCIGTVETSGASRVRRI